MGLPLSPAVAVGSAIGDSACVTHDNTSEPSSGHARGQVEEIARQLHKMQRGGGGRR